jgi:di/tricarboxylate transporter
MATLLKPFLHDRFLHLLLLLGLLLACIVPFQWRDLPAAVDWHTIVTLCGLLMLTRGIESSGYFEVLGRKLIRRFRHERALALFMVCGAALLSTFLTNDVALFILVPLTLTLRQATTLPVMRLIIFEALAVNAGSMLTPIGNPQNILLWGTSGASFGAFVWQMLPPAAVILLSLLLLTGFAFRAKPIQQQTQPPVSWRRSLLWLSVALYLLFIVALELKLAAWALLPIFAAYLLMARRVVLQIDWSLLVVFIAMFIDVHLLTRLPALQQGMQVLTQTGEGGRFLLAAGLSQVISNVPATILLLQFLPANALLAWAVNIGGFGLLPGSLANLIALRMAQDRRIWWQFHLFSIPMLLWAMLCGWLLWLLLH